MTNDIIDFVVTGNLLRKEAEPDELCVKYLTLHYVKLNASYLIYTRYKASLQINPKNYFSLNLRRNNILFIPYILNHKSHIQLNSDT